MSDQVIVSLDQVTPEWLTTVLMRSRALEHGAVTTFEVDTGHGNWSTNAHLTLKYADDAQGARPQRLFLKMVDTNVDQADDELFGDSEVTYYTRDYLDVKDAPLIPTYDAVYSEQQHRYHLLMDDVSETHVASIARPLSLEHGMALAEGLATLHAHWWGRQRLEEGNHSLPSAEAIRRYVSIAEPGAGYVLAGCADQLKPHWSPAIREFYQHHPRLMIERMQDGSGFTLVHGDLNAFNVLIPLEGDRPIYLIDRQPFDWSLTTWLGVSDFAFPLIIDCDPDTRRQMQQPILQHYHEHLIERGVRGYSWEQLWSDYRLSVAMCIYVITEWSRAALNVNAMHIWMPMLHRIMTAFDDLECDQLWAQD